MGRHAKINASLDLLPNIVEPKTMEGTIHPIIAATTAGKKT
jgi:hypothetical protein